VIFIFWRIPQKREVPAQRKLAVKANTIDYIEQWTLSKGLHGGLIQSL